MMEVGKTYTVRHQRKGTFDLLVKSVMPDQTDDIWVVGIVLHGVTFALLPENIKRPGDKITVRLDLMTYEEITDAEV